MKKMRKLLPALAMLLISAVMMSTASFAWFAMNTNVTATGMDVSAKSNDTFLQIKPKGGSITAEGVSASATNTNVQLYPAKYDSANKKYQYAYSNDQASSTAAGGYYDVPAGDLDDYVLTNEFDIFMKDSASDSSTVNLKVTGFTVTCAEADMLNAIRIVVTCGEKVQTLTAEGKTSGASNSVASPVVLADTVNETGVTVTIQVYIDGDSAGVYSNNIAKLQNASVSVAFSTEQPTA